MEVNNKMIIQYDCILDLENDDDINILVPGTKYSFEVEGNDEFILGVVISICLNYTWKIFNDDMIQKFRERSFYILNHNPYETLISKQNKYKHILYSLNPDGYETGFFVNDIDSFIQGYRTGYNLNKKHNIYPYQQKCLYLVSKHISDVKNNLELLFQREDKVYTPEIMDQLIN